MRTWSLLLFASACSGLSGKTTEITSFLEGEFASAHPGGAVGTEALGKGVWYRTPVFDGVCLQEKHLAHRDQPGRRASGNRTSFGSRISPSYDAQKDWTWSTAKGYCIYLGDGLSMSVDDVQAQGELWTADVTYTMAHPSDWWSCVAQDQKNAVIRLEETADGSFSFKDHGAFLHPGDCPAPLPAEARGRTGAKPPRAPAPRAPTPSQVQAAFERLDTALREHDHAGVLASIACYNLFESKPFGACAASELLDVGPMNDGTPRAQDGTPWTMNVFQDTQAATKVTLDRDNRSLAHAEVKAASGRQKARTVSLQWVDGEWLVVGVVQRKSEGLTRVEFVNDLDRKEKREIFDRRLGGEEIGADGHPLDPFAKPEETP